MKRYLIAIVLIVFTVAVIVSQSKAAVYEPNPCRLVHCRVRGVGLIDVPAQQVGVTPDGLAICHCPYEPPEIIYAASHYRKY